MKQDCQVFYREYQGDKGINHFHVHVLGSQMEEDKLESNVQEYDKDYLRFYENKFKNSGVIAKQTIGFLSKQASLIK